MPRQSASRTQRGDSVTDAGTERPPSALHASLGNSIPTSLTERSPQVPPKDFPKSYGIGPPSSGTPYDARARGPESGPRPTFKPPIAPSPLRHKGDSHANNSAALASTTALRDSARSQGSDAVSGQTTHPPRPSTSRNDSLESRNVSSEMTRSPGVASPLRRGGTSTVTTNGAQVSGFASTNNGGSHAPGLASRQTTHSQAWTSTSADDARSRESDAAIRQPTQHLRAISSLPHGGTPGSDSTRVHIQGSETSFGVRSDGLDCVSSRATETPPTPERQNYERTCDDPSKEVSITDDEPLSKEADSSCDSHSSTTPKQATDQQSSNGTSNQELPDTPNDELQEVDVDDLTTEDIIIAIMGPTGAGKSSFVAKATNSGDEGVGHALVSHTSEIKATRYEKGTLLSGILYFHRISDNRMAGTPLKNLRVFQKLCGNEAMSRVILVTTMWDEVEESVGMERLEELEGNYWKPMISQGSTTYRYGNTSESSKELLLQVAERKRREVRLRKQRAYMIRLQKQGTDEVRLQKQMVKEHMQLRETGAGRELYSRLDQIAEKRAEILARITAQRHQAGDQATADDLKKQYETLKAELDETLQQMQALKLTSAQRVAARIRKTFKNLVPCTLFGNHGCSFGIVVE
ncbi:hypothetical protein F5141DRAFT_1062900 [Pisolithus sp. B1]|nr:hypothetical protein F5141DRAFT_1062900 [Pisolithus sp. B1]